MRLVTLIKTDKKAIVDSDDFYIVARHTWYIFRYKRTDYAKACIGGKWVSMQEFIFPSPPNMTVDHKNNNGLDNQKANLRHATLQQQRQNMSKMSDRLGRVLTSDFKGVSFSKARKKWVAQICINGKQTCLGRFDNELDAARAYNNKAKEVYGEFAKLNLIPETEGGQRENGTERPIC